MAITIHTEKFASIKTGDEHPDTTPPETSSGLSVFVVFTSINWTLKALEKARDIARPLRANIVVLAVQVVPFPLPLDKPPVSMEFVVRCFEEKLGESDGTTHISAYLCRDLMEAFKRILIRGCPVVIGMNERWWPTRNERLARKLRRAGYSVISVKTE